MAHTRIVVPRDGPATSAILSFAAELLAEETPDPLEGHDVYTSRTDAIADRMKVLGEDIRNDLTSADQETLVRILGDARRFMDFACASLEDEYERARRVPTARSLLEHARRVRFLLVDQMRALSES